MLEFKCKWYTYLIVIVKIGLRPNSSRWSGLRIEIMNTKVKEKSFKMLKVGQYTWRVYKTKSSGIIFPLNRSSLAITIFWERKNHHRYINWMTFSIFTTCTFLIWAQSLLNSFSGKKVWAIQLETCTVRQSLSA